MKKYLLFVFVLFGLFIANNVSAIAPMDTTPPVVGPITITPSYVNPSSGVLYIRNVSTISATVSDPESEIDGTSCRYTINNGTDWNLVTTAYDGTSCIFTGVDTSLATLGINIIVRNNVGQNALSTAVTNFVVDANPPEVVYVKQASLNTVDVLFNEDLQNNPDGHHPRDVDFVVYNDVDNSGNYSEDDTLYGISGVSYDNKKVTITLTNPITSGDKPRLQMWPHGNIPTSLIDLAGNYLNNGEMFDMPIEILSTPGPQGSGPLLNQEPVQPPAGNQIPPPSNGNDQTLPPALSGNDNSGNGNGGKVLGAQTYQFTRTLRKGMKGDDVLELHKKLTELGFYKGPIDDTFGSLLEAAVKAFQKANPPLKVDGIIGPKTRAVLNK